VRFILGRFLALIPLLLGMTVLLFLVSHSLPADPVRAFLGQDATPDQIRFYRTKLGLDDPLPVQYLRYLQNLLRGDLGTSIISRRPVAKDLADFFPATLELTLAAVFLSSLVAIPLGILSAVKRGTLIDHVSRVVSLFGASMPIFWFGLLLQLVLYAKLGWLPPGDRLSNTLTPPPRLTGMFTVDALLAGNLTVFIDAVRHLILPAVALSNINLAILARITRSSMLDVLSEAYVITARAKGLHERVVIYRHTLKNAAVPILTVAGMRFGELMAGAILTETIFSWPGMGRYAVFSIERVDFPALMGFALVATTLYALVNLVVDVLYVRLDPRMSH
jgi:peptide/nickel transport system permease protein